MNNDRADNDMENTEILCDMCGAVVRDVSRWAIYANGGLHRGDEPTDFCGPACFRSWVAKGDEVSLAGWVPEPVEIKQSRYTPDEVAWDGEVRDAE